MVPSPHPFGKWELYDLVYNNPRNRLVNGIKALYMASNMIERMSEELTALEPQLAHKAMVRISTPLYLDSHKTI